MSFQPSAFGDRPFEQDTIVAMSTPVGRGGIGVVRVSGVRAREVVGPLVRLRSELKAGRARFGEIVDIAGRDEVEAGPSRMTSKGTDNGKETEAGRSRLTSKRTGNDEEAAAGPSRLTSKRTGNDEETEADPCGMTNEAGAHRNAEARVLDEAVVTYFAGPNSYTGEDVVEIAMHGAPVLLEYVVRACCERGARLAEPGEFTQRAFLAGRIDLTQAEAVDDLIGSTTLEQARVAARQMGGALARIVGPVKEELVGLIAAMEAGIDFAEDDIDVMAAERIAEKIAEVRGPLVELERSFAYGRVVREGFTLAIVGRPNAGKSSLFNRLVERERAIVTAEPGTTRDTVSERVSLAGIPVELIDTAGLRSGEALDLAERMGIARSREAMAEADVVVLVVDSLVGMGEEEGEVLEGLGGRGVILVWNKSDLVASEASYVPPIAQDAARWMGNPADEEEVLDNFGRAEEGGRARPDTPPFAQNAKDGAPGVVAGQARKVRTSAVSGEGIEELRAAIVQAVGGGEGLREGGMLTNLRQHQAVTGAVRGLDAGMAAVHAGIPHEMVLLDLYEALRGLDALTGATTNEDVLQLIFSRFCIGK